MHVQWCENNIRCSCSFPCFFLFRYSQFYTQDEFCHYNMFNHHFFDRKVKTFCMWVLYKSIHMWCWHWYLSNFLSVQEAVNVFQDFLTEEGGKKVVMVADPPFGGLVKLLGHTFSKISHTWRSLHGTGVFCVKVCTPHPPCASCSSLKVLKVKYWCIDLNSYTYSNGLFVFNPYWPSVPLFVLSNDRQQNLYTPKCELF